MRSIIITAAAIFLVTAAVNLEVPLYKTYAQAAGYGNGLTAVVFATYVAGLLPVLVFLGGISDRLGRKPVLLTGLVSAAIATAIVIIHPTMQTLLIARLFQGVGVGLSVGAGTAYLTEMMPAATSRAASLITLMTSLGFGSSALLTTVILLHQVSLVPIGYWIVFLLTIVCAGLVLSLPQRKAIGKSGLQLPYFPRGSLTAGLAVAVAWANTGLVIAILPTQLAQHGLTLWIGLILFMVNGSGVLAQPLARRLSSTQAMQIGLILLPIGYGFLLLGVQRGSLILILIGAAIAGSASYGFTYLGGLTEVARRSEQHRARAVSGYFLCADLGFGFPSIFVGFVADRVGVMTAMLGFGSIILSSSVMLSWQLHQLKSH